MLSFHFFLGILLGLATLLHAAPITENDFEPMNVTLPHGNFTGKHSTFDSDLSYHDYSTAQVWMGTKMTTVGSVIGLELYSAVYGALDRNFPARPGPSGCSGVKNSNFGGRCMKAWPALTVPCTTNIYEIHARWESPDIRHLLIQAAAGALQQMTYENVIGPTNCYDMAGTRACNVGSAVRVNFPNSDGGGTNYLHFMLYNYWTDYGNYYCCQGNKRERIDKVLDKLGPSIKEQFSGWKDKDFTRDSRCIINGWQSC
ncbi:hypothetical protein HBH98_145240 [Parastagonospora nodorum]|nr:hypothetical protein HBH47_156660 [Parastagonospora nodorum]KAH4343652.1 hypothetical protein HBH98_145240 [Parastagonospora nodorum]KAH4371164.1 hypothetical protein HBH97_137620 [Parastagonospora nodorum]KAH4394199.1 hypothetical protein HBH99_141460 [Parastagonospora nodorum]KAH4898808.1 hypothetical protein HBI80_177870 [Parastagonospora nodorum]